MGARASWPQIRGKRKEFINHPPTPKATAGEPEARGLSAVGTAEAERKGEGINHRGGEGAQRGESFSGGGFD